MACLMVYKGDERMSGKFMRIRKVVIPMISMVIMMSSIVGCSVATDKELLELINSGSSVTIELAEPDYRETETADRAFEWVQLDKLRTHDKGFRQGFDEVFNINIVTENGENGKNGVLFVDEEGNRNGNSTLYDAFRNKEFIDKYWIDGGVREDIAGLADEVYKDINDGVMERLYASLNAYYNLFDAGVDETLTREEFMSALYRAGNKVDTGLQGSKEFETAIGKATEHTKFAEQMEEYSYLNTNNKSLGDITYNGSISRAEVVYALVRTYFSKEFEGVDLEGVTFADTKNGGDLTSKLEFKGKDRAEAYTLAYMMKNPDKGLQEDLYKAMVVAKNKGIITQSESRWDEPINMIEAIEMMINSYISLNEKEGYVSTVEYGSMEIAEGTPEEEPANSPVVEIEEVSVVDEIGIVPLKPDDKPKGGSMSYREIRDGIDKFYKSLINGGYSKEDAMVEIKEAAKMNGVTVDDLNNIEGFLAIGETKPVATRPTASTPKPSTPAEPKPSTPKPSETSTSDKIVVDGVVYPVSEHGYAITEFDTDGNGVRDSKEEAKLNTDGTSSLPEGTPNPFEMP